jgi:signal transduction histidine kinase/ActR/RegA family two-component response regulator
MRLKVIPTVRVIGLQYVLPFLAALLFTAGSGLRFFPGVFDGIADLLPEPFRYLDIVGAVLAFALLAFRHQRRQKREKRVDESREATTDEAIRSELTELSSIFEVSSRVSSFTDLEEALRFIAHTAKECIDADGSNVLIRDGETLVVRAVAGRVAERAVGDGVEVGEGIAGWVAEHQRPLLLTTRRDLESFLPDRRRIESALAVPLLLDQDTLGVLTVIRSRGPDQPKLKERHQKLLGIFADYAASTINHLRMFREVEGAHTLLAKSYTQMRDIQEQLVQVEKMSAIGQLISEVSHELNNPLTTVVGYSQLLTTVNRDPEINEFLQTIQSEGSRCQTIIQNLLDFSRLNKGEREPVDLNELIGRTVDLRKYQLRIDGIQVEKNLHLGLPACTADPTRLQQVILNLLNNARQALTGNGKSGRIRFETIYESEHERIVLSVSDTGPGIPAALRERIFEPFFTTKEKGEGTGLGLAICRGIVSEIGGSIRAGTASEGGAKFEIVLPATCPAILKREETAPVYPPAARGRRFLVVDDDPKVRGLLVRILKLDDHAVVAASSAVEALEVLGHHKFDLVFTDLMMPKMTGAEFYEKIEERFPDMAERVVFFTGAALSADQVAFFRRVGRIVLRKPFKLAEIQGTIRQALAEAGIRSRVAARAD